MADLEEFRERVPVVGRMVDASFNGDKDDDETPVDFILVMSKVEGAQRITATLTNFTDPSMILGLMLKAFAEGGCRFSPLPADDETVGHA